MSKKKKECVHSGQDIVPDRLKCEDEVWEFIRFLKGNRMTTSEFEDRISKEEFAKKLSEWRIIRTKRKMRIATKRIIAWIVLCIAAFAFVAYFLAKQIMTFEWMNALWYSIAAIVASILVGLIMTEKSNIACARWRIRYENDKMHRKIEVLLSAYKTNEDIAMAVNSDPSKYILYDVNESTLEYMLYRVNEKGELERI